MRAIAAIFSRVFFDAALPRLYLDVVIVPDAFSGDRIINLLRDPRVLLRRHWD